MSIKDVILDVDGVTLDWASGFACFMQDKGFSLSTSPNVIKDQAMSDLFSDCSNPLSYIAKYQASDSYLKIKPYFGVKDYLKELKGEANVFFLSSCITDNETKKMRLAQLEEHFKGLYKDAFILPLGKSKKEILSKFNNAVYVDDFPTVALEAKEAGCKTFLQSRSYNRNIAINLPRINYLSDLDSYLNLNNNKSLYL